MTALPFWIFIGSSVVIIGGLITAVATFKNTSKQEKEKIEAAIQRAKYEQESREKSDHIAALNEQIAKDQIGLRIKADEQLELQIELRKKSDEIAELNRKIAAKGDEIVNLNRDIAASITGGDSYCYVLSSQPDIKTNASMLMLQHEGKYPLYDVSIRIDDVEKVIDYLQNDWERDSLNLGSFAMQNKMATQASKVLQLGNIGVNQMIMNLGELRLPDTDKKGFNIYITSRNGNTIQYIRFRRVSGTWRRASQLIVNGKMLREKKS